MNRIEEIKEKLNKRGYDRPLPPAIGRADMSVSKDIQYLLSEVDNLKRALLDCRIGLAAAINQKGGKIEFKYDEFYQFRRNPEIEFKKYENYSKDSVVIELKLRED